MNSEKVYLPCVIPICLLAIVYDFQVGSHDNWLMHQIIQIYKFANIYCINSTFITKFQDGGLLLLKLPITHQSFTNTMHVNVIIRCI